VAPALRGNDALVTHADQRPAYNPNCFCMLHLEFNSTLNFHCDKARASYIARKETFPGEYKKTTSHILQMEVSKNFGTVSRKQSGSKFLTSFIFYILEVMCAELDA
jgi:hypothetical protein